MKIKLIILTALIIFSGQCLADEYFEIAIIRDEIYLDGTKVSLETVEKSLQTPSRPAYLFSVDPDKVKYLSIILYITRNEHGLYLSENEDFTLISNPKGGVVFREQ